MNTITKETISSWYKENFQNQLKGRRIVFDDIEPIIEKLDKDLYKTEILGKSEKGVAIYKITIGNGPKKILSWSQMHGNESTGTKAMFDLFNFFSNPGDFKELATALLSKVTLVFIPMLNPDGSDAFTRVNSNEIDLNRDAVDRVAVESNLLRELLDAFNPKFCFNLHDQRTIFNVAGTKNPATISFLAPSEDLERTLTAGRKETMSAIVAMNKLVQRFIPNHVGRYTDEFYPTATGDNFQKLGHNTVLIEAGHYYNDYERDTVREYNFYALVEGIRFIAFEDDYADYTPYFEIPENDKKCYDIIHRNVLSDDGTTYDIAYQYDYKVVNDQLVFVQEEAARGDLSEFIGHKEIDGKK